MGNRRTCLKRRNCPNQSCLNRSSTVQVACLSCPLSFPFTHRRIVPTNSKERETAEFPAKSLRIFLNRKVFPPFSDAAGKKGRQGHFFSQMENLQLVVACSGPRLTCAHRDKLESVNGRRSNGLRNVIYSCFIRDRLSLTDRLAVTSLIGMLKLIYPHMHNCREIPPSFSWHWENSAYVTTVQ